MNTLCTVQLEHGHIWYRQIQPPDRTKRSLLEILISCSHLHEDAFNQWPVLRRSSCMLTIQCRRNPIRPVMDLTAEMNPPCSIMWYNHDRHHCLLLSHEVMAILMLMTLGSSLWSHPATIATPISHLIACDNDHSDDFPVVIIYCSEKSPQDREISLAQTDWAWADDSMLGHSRSWRWTDWNIKFRAWYWLHEYHQMNRHQIATHKRTTTHLA